MQLVPNEVSILGYMKGAYKTNPAVDDGSQGNKGEMLGSYLFYGKCKLKKPS
jgi:hypothetical protein